MRSRAGAATDVERLENAGEIAGIEAQTDGLEFLWFCRRCRHLARSSADRGFVETKRVVVVLGCNVWNEGSSDCVRVFVLWAAVERSSADRRVSG